MREMRWTDEQAAAITTNGHVLLAASAGTGKTTTVVGKILWLLGLDVGVRDSDGEPLPRCLEPCRLEEIAAITFTEKAAYDLKGKLRKEIERSEGAEDLRWEIDRASIGTIHAFCGELLRDHSLRLGIDPTFRVLDERETMLQQEEIIRDVLMKALEARDPGAVSLVKRFHLNRRGRARGTVDKVVEVLRDVRWRARRYEDWTRWVEGDRELDQERLQQLAREHGRDEEADALQGVDGSAFDYSAALYRYAFRAQRRWLAWLEDENVRDFDSLILDARRLLTRQDTRPALEDIRRRFRILIIDEFQDTDTVQRDIAFAIAGLAGGTSDDQAPGGPPLFLVGDPKQSIYRFRGADISVWNQVRSTLSGEAEPIQLTHNFRSEPQVVDFVNRVCSKAMRESAEAIEPECPESRVDYQDLTPWRDPVDAPAIEWLVTDEAAPGSTVPETEARLVASRISRMVGNVRVTDPDSGERRRCAFRDIAVLGRRRANLAAIERGLRQYGIPCYNTATGGLANRQEILDLVTVLKLIDNPHDDYHAFAFLRSPFVGLRDETLARIRLDETTGGSSLLRQAERFLGSDSSVAPEWFAAPESDRIVGIERRALAVGLGLIRDAQELADRANTAELLETIVERTGYRLHLLLRDGAAEAFANIERFFAMLEEYRHLSLGSFLGLWERWGEQDLGIPQAPLYSKEDDVVTLSTIHTAKGLEWPVVFLVATREPLTRAPLQTYKYWSDRALGPVFTLRKAERGPRSENLLQRELLEETAEETRLLYVAATRARDRLVISGPTEPTAGYAQWLAVGLEDAVEEHEAGPLDDGSARSPGAEGERQRRRAGRDSPGDDDLRTGTGRQIDAFGMDQEPVDAAGQFNLFTPGGARNGPLAEDTGEAPADPTVVGHIDRSHRPAVVYRRAEPIQSTLAQPPLTLGWLENIEPTDPPRLVQPIEASVLRFTSSATELMMKSRDPHGWERRYRHGVIPSWQFAPQRDGEDLPPTLRGELIHGVLERIQEVEDLARVLNETIAGIDAPEMEQLLEPGGPYREALEAEIEEVVRSDRWAWYVEGEHYRELPFVHLRGPAEWRQGALDLYRPQSGADSHIIDFKTHQIDAEKTAAKAAEYEIQAGVYRDVARALGPSGKVRVAFHFTHPNVAVEV